MKYALNLVRSAMAPDTIVAAVAAKATWKMKNVGRLRLPQVPSGHSAGFRNQPLVPMKSLPEPKAKAKPTAPNTSTPTTKSIRFFIMMLATLLARVSPASTSANPACMKITSTAAISTQMLSRMACTLSAASGSSTSCAMAGALSATTLNATRPRPTVSFLRMLLLRLPSASGDAETMNDS